MDKHRYHYIKEEDGHIVVGKLIEKGSGLALKFIPNLFEGDKEKTKIFVDGVVHAMQTMEDKNSVDAGGVKYIGYFA